MNTTIDESLLSADSLSIYETLSDGLIICDAVMPGYPIVYVSDGFCSFTGYSRDEILNKSCNFLQGEATCHVTVNEIRDALKHKGSYHGKILFDAYSL